MSFARIHAVKTISRELMIMLIVDLRLRRASQPREARGW